MKKIGKYKICGFLGHGGMGKIYKIQYPVTGKMGALKLLAPNPFLTSLMGDKSIEEMFTAEAVKMAGIRHPNIVEILDFDRSNDNLFYIMNYYCNNLGIMIGESYEPEKRSRVISIDKAIYYTRQVLSGLARLHFASIIHRDIKPYNILVTDEDTVKICDFGLSKLRGEAFKGHKSLKIGSPYYAPPELEKDPDTVDFSCDLYSVGIMLFRMITGRLPDDKNRRVSLLNKDLDINWDAFIFRATDPVPQKRFATVEQMQSALDELETAWEKRKKRIGSVSFPEIKEEETLIKHRSTPLKIRKKEAGNIFHTDNLMRPAAYTPNRFFPVSSEIIHDKTTGLCWQISGTRFPVTHPEAKEYILTLNKENYQGHNDWRLPTTNELLSLVNKTPEGEAYCIESIFDTSQKWFWTGDRCSYITAWYVSLELGYAWINDMTGYYHAKAVRSVELPEKADKSYVP